MTFPTTESLGSVHEGEDVWPFPWFEQVQELGDVVWAPELNAWLVTSYENVRFVSRNDDVLFGRNFELREGVSHVGLTDEQWEWFMGGGSVRAALFMNTGEEHTQQHRWWMRTFSQRVLERWRETLYRPHCHEAIDRFAAAGRAELLEDYTERVAPRAMAAMLGLPADDQAWLTRLVELFDIRTALMAADTLLGGAQPDPALVERALAATHELYDAMLPYVEERRSGEGDDFISMVWREAPNVFGTDFDKQDVFSAAITMWSAGAGSVAKAGGNALYLLVINPQLHDRIRADERALKALIEESFRMFQPLAWHARYAKQDIQLGGVTIRKGDNILAAAASAHRDTDHYPHPDEIDLDRDSPRDHFGFFAGPRACPGQGLARVELKELLLAILERLPDVRLDPDAEPPRYKGLLSRRWEPLEVVFTPA